MEIPASGLELLDSVLRSYLLLILGTSLAYTQLRAINPGQPQPSRSDALPGVYALMGQECSPPAPPNMGCSRNISPQTCAAASWTMAIRRPSTTRQREGEAALGPHEISIDRLMGDYEKDPTSDGTSRLPGRRAIKSAQAPYNNCFAEVLRALRAKVGNIRMP